jgi:DNA-binding CsgD family transcriptional regulator
VTKEEQKIINLYIISKLSEQQIAERLSLNPSRVRWVLKKHKVQKRSISEAVRYLYITKFNKKEFILNTKLTSEQERLKLAGAMLYWGEGTKRGYNVALANSDPVMVALFVRFLREICGIDKNRLHVTLHRYPNQNEPLLKKFWAKTLSIPIKQFYNSYTHLNTKGSYKKKSQYGTVSVQYSDVALLRVIIKWISEYSVLSKPA